jgi:hypothetical protein
MVKNVVARSPIIHTKAEHSRFSLGAAAAWVFCGPRVSAERVQRAMSARTPWERATEPWAVACGALWMAMVAAPTSFVEIGGIPLLLVSVARARATGRALALFFQTPMWWLLLAWATWQGISLLWSPDAAQGVDEITSMRWAWSLLLVFPLLRHRRALVAAMAAGFLAGNLSQVAHGLGGALGVEWLRFDRASMRNSGWWDPVVGGTLLVGALGLHLPAAMLGAGGASVSPVREGLPRWAGVLGSAITLIAIFATGTRGAWLAGVGLVVIVGAVAIARAPGALSWRRMGMGFAGAAVVAIAAWLFAGEAIGGRVREARGEIARAMEGDYGTYTGQRILMAKWAAEAFGARPVGGVGAGGYKAWVWEKLEAEGVPESERGVGAHAHNMVLHVAATAGVAGVVVFALAWVVAVRAGVTQSSKFKVQSSKMEGYDYGPACALVGLLLAGATDAVHVNAQTAAMWLALVSLCPVWRMRKNQ